MSTNEDIYKKALNKAFNGGIAGSSAMVVQITSLMWLRTAMNYEYRYGTSTTNTMKILYKEGGIRRFYRGYIPALAIGPLARFGDTAANAYIMNIFENNKDLPTAVKTISGSFIASTWRAMLMPIDAVKTSLQVDGKQGLTNLKNKIKITGPSTLFHGTLASMSATFVGHYPWFLTYNILNEKIPRQQETHLKLMRNAVIGFTSAVISDCSSNSLRVIKTMRQTNQSSISYADTVKLIVKNEGLTGLFGRGLKTRIITNGCQGILFTICWKYFEEILSSK